MTQNNVANTMLLNPKILDIPHKSSVKGLGKSDDTFMNLLSERIQAKNSSEKAKQRYMEKSNSHTDRGYPVTIIRRESVEKESVIFKKPADTNGAKVQDDPERLNTQEVSKNESDHKNKEETISSLESMVLLLEDILAQWGAEVVSAKPAEDDSPSERIKTSLGESSPEELLKAILKGNTEKLNLLMDEMDESKQTPEFINLLKNIQELMEKFSKEQYGLKNMFNINVEAENVTTKEELINQFKVQCSEIIDKLEAKISGLTKSLAQSVKDENETPEVILPITTEPQLSEKLQNHTKVSAGNEQPDAKEVNKKTNNPHSGQESSHDKTTLENKGSIHQDFVILDEQKPQDIVAVKADKIHPPLTEKPLAQTVTNQIIMKVKLMAGENKQELEMHLKPESLGKLSLKIIHERGEILAKITAENEQVKGILESNMQLLKDALEKSGLSVQSLSVSVGNQKEQQNQREQNHGSGSTFGRKVEGSTEIKKNISRIGTLYERSLISDYSEETSQINLTA